MEHERCMELLSLRVDGPLSEAEEGALEDHLARCPDCRALAEQLERLHDGFAGLEELSAPEGFTGQVMERVRGKSRPVPLFRRPQFKALAGLAACLAICVGIYGAGQWGGQNAVLTDETGSAGLYARTPEGGGQDPELQTAQRYDASPRVSAALVEPEEGAADSAYDNTSGEGEGQLAAREVPEAEAVLTLSALPEGAAELLSEDTVVSHCVADGSDTYSPLTLEQLNAIEALAQDQGITASRTTGEGGTGPCLLIVAGA